MSSRIKNQGQYLFWIFKNIIFKKLCPLNAPSPLLAQNISTFCFGSLTGHELSPPFPPSSWEKPLKMENVSKGQKISEMVKKWQEHYILPLIFSLDFQAFLKGISGLYYGWYDFHKHFPVANCVSKVQQFRHWNNFCESYSSFIFIDHSWGKTFQKLSRLGQGGGGAGYEIFC